MRMPGLHTGALTACHGDARAQQRLTKQIPMIYHAAVAALMAAPRPFSKEASAELLAASAAHTPSCEAEHV